MKVATIIGARPQFIKAAVVSRAFREHPKNIQDIIVHTGQHYDTNMSDVFFDELDIPYPDYNLGIGGGTHGQNTGRMIEMIEEVIIQEKPDLLIVYGDTDSTLAGALAAVKLHVTVAHVEAGLRSFNRRMPEEINRVLVDHASDLLFTPTSTAIKNLESEGISRETICHVGDVMYDAALYYSKKAENKSRIFNKLELESKKYVLATVHRAENTDSVDKLRGIFDGLGSLDMPVILPLHPRTAKALYSHRLTLPKNIMAIDPVGYLDMVMLEKHAFIIATDSGGVQKEAYFHRVPCVTLRDETEWIELVDAGWNVLVGCSKDAINCAIISAKDINLDCPDAYGLGDAGWSIVKNLINRDKFK